MKLTAAIEEIRRARIGDMRVIDTARLKGNVLVIITEHEADLRPHLESIQVTKRLSVYVGEDQKTSIITSTKHKART